MLSGLNTLGSLWIIGLMLLVCADVVGRSGFNHPIDGVSEIAAFSVVGIMFLQAAATVHSGRMTQSTMLLEWVAARSRRLRNAIEACYMLLGAVMFALIVRAAWPDLLRSINRSEFFGLPGMFTMPTWPVRLMVVVGASAVVLVYLLKVWDLLMPPKDTVHV
jgi:TRAP-type C4-dicarboxylate transport system permease small subunit